MQTKLLSILNLIVVIVLIAWNGYANTGNFNGKTVGDLSAEYNNLFTPSSYAFSIWGLIFLMLIIYSINVVIVSFKGHKSDDYNKSQLLNKAAPWFLVANIFCTIWVAFWLEEMIFISVLCMSGILLSLLKCVVILRIEQYEIPAIDKFLIWLPISFYTGWISVATVANISAWLNSAFEISLFTQEIIMVIILLVTFVIYAYMLFARRLRVYALVGIWALIAIGVRHWISDLSIEEHHFMGIISITIALILGLAVLIKSFRKPI